MSAQTPQTLEEMKETARRGSQRMKDMHWNSLVARFGGQTAEAHQLFREFCELADKCQAEYFAKLDAMEAAAQKTIDRVRRAVAIGDNREIRNLMDEWARTYGTPPTV